MTKVKFDYQELQSKLIPKLDATVLHLNKILDISNQTIFPRNFNSSTYKDALSKIKNTENGLKNTITDIKNANINYENAENINKRTNANFTSDFAIDLDRPIIEID